MNNCFICDFKTDSYQKLSKHILHTHKLKSKEYYDKYIKTESEGSCIICGEPTSFQYLSSGYSICCKSRKCSGKYHRNKLQNNPAKFDKFKQAVSKNMESIWEKREKSGEKQEIIEKVTNTNKEIISKLSKDERINRFGWMNKLSPIEKQKKIKEILDKSLKKWHNEATEEQKALQSFRKKATCFS